MVRPGAHWKPARYVPDPRLRHAFRRAHPRCCLEDGTGDCFYLLGRAHAHHIIHKGRAGCSDAWWNLLPLCEAHHTGWAGVPGWHTFGDPELWLAHYAARLEVDVVTKVTAALARAAPTATAP